MAKPVPGWALFQGRHALPLRPPPKEQWAGRASGALILTAASNLSANTPNSFCREGPSFQL